MIFQIVYAIVCPFFHLLFPFQVVGKEKLRQHEGGYILCCNHISMLDPVYIILALKRKKRIFFMAKKELFRNKFWGWLLGKLGAFPVNRGAGASGGLKTAQEILAANQSLGIFPEGTRSKDGKLSKAKAGAAMLVNACNTYVLPVTLVTKNQKIRMFRKATLIIGDPVIMPPQEEGMSQREYLRVCTAAIMSPIEKGLEEYAIRE